MIYCNYLIDKKFKVISFFTENYYEYFKKFYSSLNKYKLDYHVEFLEGKWEWKEACNHKAQFILKCLNIFSMPVVWIDCDAVVHSSLEYFNNLMDKDVGFYFRDNREILSGTLFFNNTEKSKELLKLWRGESKKTNMWDQRNLQNVIRLCKDLRIEYLPVEYCYFDLLKNRVTGKIHIEHFQASRKFNPDHPVYGGNKWRTQNN